MENSIRPFETARAASKIATLDCERSFFFLARDTTKRIVSSPMGWSFNYLDVDSQKNTGNPPKMGVEISQTVWQRNRFSWEISPGQAHCAVLRNQQRGSRSWILSAVWSFFVRSDRAKLCLIRYRKCLSRRAPFRFGHGQHGPLRLGELGVIG